MINFKTENEPKIKFFDSGAFQKIEKLLSHEKILFHMLFGAFHDTPCICFHISGVIRPLHISVNISPKLKSLKYYIYGSIYAACRNIYIYIYIYVRSYNDRYIKTYILPIYVMVL